MQYSPRKKRQQRQSMASSSGLGATEHPCKWNALISTYLLLLRSARKHHITSVTHETLSTLRRTQSIMILKVIPNLSLWLLWVQKSDSSRQLFFISQLPAEHWDTKSTSVPSSLCLDRGTRKETYTVWFISDCSIWFLERAGLPWLFRGQLSESPLQPAEANQIVLSSSSSTMCAKHWRP